MNDEQNVGGVGGDSVEGNVGNDAKQAAIGKDIKQDTTTATGNVVNVYNQPPEPSQPERRRRRRGELDPMEAEDLRRSITEVERFAREIDKVVSTDKVSVAAKFEAINANVHSIQTGMVTLRAQIEQMMNARLVPVEVVREQLERAAKNDNRNTILLGVAIAVLVVIAAILATGGPV